MHLLASLLFAGNAFVFPAPPPVAPPPKAPPGVPQQYVNPNSYCSIGSTPVDCAYLRMLRIGGASGGASGGDSGGDSGGGGGSAE